MLSYSTGHCKFGKTFTECEKFLSKNIQLKMYRTTLLPVVLYGCETQSLILREERGLRMFENRVLRRIFGPKTDEITGEWRKLRKQLIIRTAHQMLCGDQIDEMGGAYSKFGERSDVYRVLVGKGEGKRPIGRPRPRKAVLRWIFRKWDGNLNWIYLV